MEVVSDSAPHLPDDSTYIQYMFEIYLLNINVVQHFCPSGFDFVVEVPLFSKMLELIVLQLLFCNVKLERVHDSVMQCCWKL